MNPDYAGFVAGRIEVYYQPEKGDTCIPCGYSDDEIPWLTKDQDGFYVFREMMDLATLNGPEALAALKTYMAKHWQVSLDDMQKFVKEKIDGDTRTTDT
jgi:hypothetical protein